MQWHTSRTIPLPPTPLYLSQVPTSTVGIHLQPIGLPEECSNLFVIRSLHSEIVDITFKVHGIERVVHSSSPH